MSTFGNVMGTMYKAYVYKTLLSDVSRFVRRTFDDFDFDKESLLNRVGLSTHTPVRNAIGGASCLLLGAAIGTAIGLALAPKPGVELRAEVKEKARDLLRRAEETAEETIERRVHA